MRKERLESLIDDSLKKHSDLFLIDFKVDQSNQIKVVIDGDHPISVKDCMSINRDLEQRLDLEEEDYSVVVTSAGLSAPLQLPRQYKKNIGRKLEVKTETDKYKAKLDAVDNEGITLKWKQREPKPIGKGKHTVEKEVNLPYEAIKEAKVMITFNK